MRQLFLAIFFALGLTSPASAGILWFSGFETGTIGTGNTSELWTTCLAPGVSGSPTLDTTTVRSGNYSLKFPAGGTANHSFGICSAPTTLYVRLYFYPTAAPSPAGSIFNVGTGTFLRFSWNSDRTARLDFNGTTGDNSTGKITLNAWNTALVKLVDHASAGGYELILNGTLEISRFNINTSAVTMNSFYFFHEGMATGDSFFDDVMLRDDAYPAGGKVIVRQGTSGSPTYTAWTLNSCTSSLIENCWSQTPFNATPNASTSTLNAKQTMILAPFGITQSGHGTETIGAHDTINAANFALVWKYGSVAALDYITIFGGTETSTASLGANTTDRYIFNIVTSPPSADNLRGAAEIGVKKTDTNGVTVTVEDIWYMIDYAAGVGISQQVDQE